MTFAKTNTVKEIILHIGIPKTGSTSIQQSLFDNQKILKEHGIIYPVLEGINHAHINLCTIPNAQREYYNIVKDRLTKRKLNSHKKHFYKMLKKEIRIVKPEKIVISTESLFKKLNINFINLLSKATSTDVKFSIICYLREPAEWFVSSTQQMIKYPFCEKDSWHGELTCNEGIGYFEKYIKLFGKENVHVYRLEDAAQHHNGLIGHFYSKLGIEDISINKEITTENQSISLEAASVLKYINDKIPLFVNQEVNKANGRKLYDTNMLFNIGNIKFNLPDDTKDKFYKKTHNFRKYILQEFGIDYPTIDINGDSPPEFLSIQTVNQLKQLMPKLSETIKEFVVKFLNEYSGRNLYEVFK